MQLVLVTMSRTSGTCKLGRERMAEECEVMLCPNGTYQ